MLQQLKDWYTGKWVPSDRDRHVIMMGYYRKHWTATVTHALVDFYFREWKWIWGMVITITGLLIGVMRLK